MELNDKQLLHSRCFLNGIWVNAHDFAVMTVTNPATGEQIAQVPYCGASETESAIMAADSALAEWRATTASERSQILRRWFDLMLLHQNDLAQIMTAEQGKPLAEAVGEIRYAASYVEWFAEEAKRAYGEVIPSPFKDKQLLVVKEPVGVCAAITPWNFPAAMITRKVAPALAAGCTMVVKPAEQTPLTALALAELAQRAGVPAGVLNIITGDATAIGGVLTRSPVVRKLSFTGSTAIGQLLMQQCSSTLKKLSLELGGNAPFIVFEDANLDEAVAGAMVSKYRNTGQTCVCSNRFLVHDAIYNAFAERLTQAVQDLKMGNGMDEGVTQGPLIDEAALHKVESLVADALQKGARVHVGGFRSVSSGQWYAPTVLSEVTSEMAIARDEVFGPVAPLFRFESEAQAMQMANDTEYGLAAYFFTQDPARIWRVARQLDYGMVGINTGMISSEVVPFGGVKMSGLGREGSRHGLDEYMELKYLAYGGLAEK